jgi:serine/threonine protein kinase
MSSIPRHSMIKKMPVVAHTGWDTSLEKECPRHDRVNEERHRLRMETTSRAPEEISHRTNEGSGRTFLSRSSAFKANMRLPRITSKSDVWSLGCVMLEAMVWLVHGRSNKDSDDSSAQHARLLRSAELRKSSLLKRALMNQRTSASGQLDSGIDKYNNWCAGVAASSSSLFSCARGSTAIVGMPRRISPVRPAITADFRLRNAMSLGRKDTCGNELLSSALKLL